MIPKAYDSPMNAVAGCENFMVWPRKPMGKGNESKGGKAAGKSRTGKMSRSKKSY